MINYLLVIYITPAIGDRSRGGLLMYYGCSHTPEGRRNVGHVYVTEITFFHIFFSTGKGGNGHTHSTPQHTAPNYPPIGLTSVSHRSRIGLASSVSHHRNRPQIIPKFKFKLGVISYSTLQLRRFTPLRREVHSIKEVHTIKRGGSLHKGGSHH